MKPFQLLDKYSTPLGELTVGYIGHGSLMLQINGKTIQVDPYSEVADYATVPKADMILITHSHYDHLDKTALEKIIKANTKFISTELVAKELNEVEVLRNGDTTTWENILIEAFPAYNIRQMNPSGNPFHPKGEGNGYILNFGDFRLYIAGDTELIPEMKSLGKIDIAFLPKNLPYTMSDGMFVETAKLLQPKVLYPYHYFEVDKESLRKALPGIDIR